MSIFDLLISYSFVHYLTNFTYKIHYYICLYYRLFYLRYLPSFIETFACIYVSVRKKMSTALAVDLCLCLITLLWHISFVLFSRLKTHCVQE